jgi:hypothetical protein
MKNHSLQTMIEVKLTKDELNVLMFSLNNMGLVDEEDFVKQGVSVFGLYNKIYTAWEQLSD